MNDSHHAQGPGKNILGMGQRIVTLAVQMVETRLRLAVVELEEEKANLIQLLLMAGLTLLFTAFGLMSLLVLVIWAVDPQYRLHVMMATTGTLLLLALIGGIWTIRKARRSTLLHHTRHELANDRALLEDDKP
ncbi:phage holin family protein [Kluyvera ascorbata]|uniref:phage holin family protein n=1 Tax=Kluyvera ascorbata TaxID=51288 RepID=UPI0039F70254